jgi:Cu(I)/Ag(I) efflux system membrane protein CusA/SilA
MSTVGGQPSWIDKIIRFCLENKLVVILGLIAITFWGISVAPFAWDIDAIPRDPVPVDAIPDIGENQQIVFTEWTGRSPQDVEDQIGYPLTVSLLGIPGVKTIRSYSMFGFSTIYIIFNEDIEFYWSRSRVLEKLNSLPTGTVPAGVAPALGPDATALGQIFWYTLEGQDPDGKPTGGWDLDELRSAQDWYVRYAFQAVEGVSEVASVGGFVREYQIDVDPDAMRAYNISLEQVFSAVRMSNVDVGARTIEVNRVEYVIRGIGFLKDLDDIRRTAIAVHDNVPVYVENIATVNLGPALRRGVLDKAGAEAVGGVVVVRYGENPLATIDRLKKKIEEISPGLPSKILEDGTVSRLAVVPFYDRTGLIHETLGTLEEALTLEILITIIVVIFMLGNLKSSVLISALLPLAVLMSFICMKIFHVDANIVALSGIAIAIGTMVDMGVILSENMLSHLKEARADENRLEVIYRAASEVGGAVVTAVATTVVSFLPVFTMEAAEGKLFRPLAYTKTFALLASLVVAITLMPPFAHLLFGKKMPGGWPRRILHLAVVLAGLWLAISVSWRVGLLLMGVGAFLLFRARIPARVDAAIQRWSNWIFLLLVGLVLTHEWLPLGPQKGMIRNSVFLLLVIGGLLFCIHLFSRSYKRILTLCLKHKLAFLVFPAALMLFGTFVWLGAEQVLGFMPDTVLRSRPVAALAASFPGLGKEFMPDLDEGSYLYMPTTMPHASIGEAADVLAKLDMAIQSIPEVDLVVGKLGRAETPLDSAPISMIETVINYKSEYVIDDKGRRTRFLYRDGEYAHDEMGQLIEDSRGRPFRQWRSHINSPDDIWKEIVAVTKLPGTTSAPKLQPIAARIVMLQSGMRAPMGIKVKGPDLETIERVGLELERILQDVPSVEASAVFADRVVGKPYLEIEIDREAIARYGIPLHKVQDAIEVAVGGKRITTTVEGRERYPVRVRYPRELRDQIESLGEILIAAGSGEQIPLTQLSVINYVRGPQVIKSEDTFLVSYVLFDKKVDQAEVDVVQDAEREIQRQLTSGEFILPSGVSYKFAGSYENQVRSEKRLRVVLPLALFAIFIILYFQFSSVSTTAMVFSGIFVAWSGGFLMIWLYAQPWFLDFDMFGVNLRVLFQVHPINLSVAIWVGFIALFGIASDDGVIMATYLQQSFREKRPNSIEEIRQATVDAGMRRVRPCLMTIATTVLALLPVLSSTGKGSDIMVPMAIPSFGGMVMATLTMFVVPVLFCMRQEFSYHLSQRGAATSSISDPEPGHAS